MREKPINLCNSCVWEHTKCLVFTKQDKDNNVIECNGYDERDWELEQK